MKKLIAWILFLVLIVGTCGCIRGQRREIANSYSEEKVKELTKEYIEGKYGDKDISIGKIGVFDGPEGGIDATSIAGIEGFIIEVDSCKVYMSLKSKDNYEFTDDKQSHEIELAVRQRVAMFSPYKCYVSMKGSNKYQDLELPEYNDFMHSYKIRFDGNLKKLFEEDRKEHHANIYLLKESNGPKLGISMIQNGMKNIKLSCDIYEFSKEEYDELRMHFDDYDYMQKYSDHIRK